MRARTPWHANHDQKKRRIIIASEDGPVAMIPADSPKCWENARFIVEAAAAWDLGFGALITELQAIDGDERFHYPTATVVENAPLALIQLEMSARAGLAKRLLELYGYRGPEMAIKRGPRK